MRAGAVPSVWLVGSFWHIRTSILYLKGFDNDARGVFGYVCICLKNII